MAITFPLHSPLLPIPDKPSEISFAISLRWETYRYIHPLPWGVCCSVRFCLVLEGALSGSNSLFFFFNFRVLFSRQSVEMVQPTVITLSQVVCEVLGDFLN